TIAESLQRPDARRHRVFVLSTCALSYVMIPPSRAPVTTTSLRPCLAARRAAAGASARAIADGLYGLYANPRSMDSKRGAGYLVRQSSGHAGLRASLSTVYNPFADGYARMSQNDPVSA